MVVDREEKEEVRYWVGAGRRKSRRDCGASGDCEI